MEAMVRFRVSPGGICGGQLALGQVFPQVLRFFFPVSIIPP
jgi:hypothetical protein